jgi:hypothetical protein
MEYGKTGENKRKNNIKTYVKTGMFHGFVFSVWFLVFRVCTLIPHFYGQTQNTKYQIPISFRHQSQIPHGQEDGQGKKPNHRSQAHR